MGKIIGLRAKQLFAEGLTVVLGAIALGSIIEALREAYYGNIAALLMYGGFGITIIVLAICLVGYIYSDIKPKVKAIREKHDMTGAMHASG